MTAFWIYSLILPANLISKGGSFSEDIMVLVRSSILGAKSLSAYFLKCKSRLYLYLFLWQFSGKICQNVQKDLRIKLWTTPQTSKEQQEQVRYHWLLSAKSFTSTLYHYIHHQGRSDLKVVAKYVYEENELLQGRQYRGFNSQPPQILAGIEEEILF